MTAARAAFCSDAWSCRHGWAPADSCTATIVEVAGDGIGGGVADGEFDALRVAGGDGALVLVALIAAHRAVAGNHPGPQHLTRRRPRRERFSSRSDSVRPRSLRSAWPRVSRIGLSGCSSVVVSIDVPAKPPSRNGVKPPLCGLAGGGRRQSAPALSRMPRPRRARSRSLRRRVASSWPTSRPPPGR